MIQLYGHMWKSLYTSCDATHNTWRDVFVGLTPEQVKLGLDEMKSREEFAKYPPKPLEFRALCKPKENEQSDYFLKDALKEFLSTHIDKLLESYQRKIEQNLKLAIMHAKTDKNVASNYIDEIYAQLKEIIN